VAAVCQRARTRETFTVRGEAIERAEQLAQELSEGLAQGVDFTLPDRESWRHIVLQCDAAKVVPHLLVEEALAARAALPAGVTLLDAALKAAAALAREGPLLPPTLELMERMVKALETHPHRPRSKKRCDELRGRLKRFAKAYPSLTTPTRLDIERYLLGLGVGAKTHDNNLATIVQLYRFALDHGWPVGRALPTTGLEGFYEPGVPSTFSAATLRTLLGTVDAAWIPFVAIGAFAGLRPSEVYRLRWENFRWGEKVIAVSATVAAKVRRPRLVPISDNLAAWLAVARQDFGPVYPAPTLRSLEKRQRRMIATLRDRLQGFTWPHDVLRHSFGSYRLAQTQNLAQVVLEMGTSESMLKRYYNDPKTPEQAVEWFAIAPDNKKVIPMTRPTKAKG
jgi:integrase